VSRTTLRIIIILAAFSIAGITFTQIYWVRKAFDLRENQFNRDVNTALSSVASKIFEINKTPSPANNPVTQLSTNYFVVLVNGPIDASLLEFLLATEFEKRNIKAEFEYGIYNCIDKCMEGGNNVSPRKNIKASMPAFPHWKDDGYYFGVQFPAIEVLKDPGIIHTPERLLNYATIIQNENQRLKQQVERVLQMARIEKEDIGLKKEISDVHELIKEAVKNTSLTLTEKKGTITLDLKAEPSTTSVDKLHFTNVIYNLLDNAIKYTQRSPEIIIRTLTVNNSILLEVQDNGIGINDDEQRKIFHRFYRVSTGNLHDVKGFGLGLNYVKLITEAHKGKISVTSLIGNGSTFKLVVPIV